MFKGGKTEGWGRGILDIFTLCKEEGLPEPEYDFVPNFVCLTIRFKNPLRPYLTGESNGALNGDLNGELNEVLKGLSSCVQTTYGIIKLSTLEVRINHPIVFLPECLPSIHSELGHWL